jgi:hypothetical protein
MPPILQQVALDPDRLLTTYVTTSYTSYIGKIDDLDGLEIVEVAYGGLAAGRGVIWLRVRLWVSDANPLGFVPNLSERGDR